MSFNQVILENHSCPLGCQSNDKPVLIGHDRLNNLPGEFQVVKCCTCGLMRTNPRPTPETIGFYYPDDYGPYQGTKISEDNPSNNSLPFWKRLVKRIFEFNTTLLPSLSPGRMLEIGCASGSFLHKMAALGWEVEGLEFSEKAAESARSLGYIVHTGALENAPNPEKPYDLVVGWMVLEHLHEPIVCLEKLHRWVRPGGSLVFSVPNAESLDFHWFKDTWYALHLPNHLYHYTPSTIHTVLQRSGWKIEKVRHHRVLRNLTGSLVYSLKDAGYKGSLSQSFMNLATHPAMSYLLYPFAYILSFFGQTGGMTIWARRIDD